MGEEVPGMGQGCWKGLGDRWAAVGGGEVEGGSRMRLGSLLKVTE